MRLARLFTLLALLGMLLSACAAPAPGASAPAGQATEAAATTVVAAGRHRSVAARGDGSHSRHVALRLPHRLHGRPAVDYVRTPS